MTDSTTIYTIANITETSIKYVKADVFINGTKSHYGKPSETKSLLIAIKFAKEFTAEKYQKTLPSKFNLYKVCSLILSYTK